MEKINRVLTGFSTNVFGNLIMLLTTLVIARLVTPEVYGEFRLVFNIMSVLSIGLLLGRDTGLIYFDQKTTDTNQKQQLRSEEVVFSFLSISLICLVLSLFSSVIAEKVFNNNLTAHIVSISFIMVPLWALFNLLTPIIRLNDKINFSFLLTNFIQRLVRLPLLIAAAYFISTTLGLVWAMIVSQVLLILIALKHTKINFKNLNFKNFLNRSSYSFHLGMNTLAIVLLSKLDVLFLGAMSSSTNVAIYDIAAMFSLVLLFPFMALVKSSDVSMFEIHKNEKSKQGYFHNLNIAVALSFLGVCFLVLFSKEILTLYGSVYIAGQNVIILLSLFFFLVSTIGGSLEILSMNGKVKLVSYAVLLSIILCALLNYLLIPLYGLLGAAISTGIAMITARAVATVFVRRQLQNFKRPKPHFTLILIYSGIIALTIIFRDQVIGIKVLCYLMILMGFAPFVIRQLKLR